MDNTNWESLEFKEVVELDNIQSWRAGDPGDYIIGKYKETKQGSGKGENYLFHILEDQDGQLLSILGCTVLNRKLEQIEAETIIKIEYRGKEKAQNGRQYNNYAVFVAE